MPDPDTKSVDVRVKGKVCQLILTKTQVRMHSSASIFQDATTVIPIASVDSVFYGWKRNWALLLIGCLFALLGLGIIGRNSDGGIILLIIGSIGFAAFWLYKPGLLLVNSVRESLGGTPLSEEAAKEFTELVAAAVVAAKQ